MLKMIDAAKNNPNFNDGQADIIAANYTWSNIFRQLKAVYHDVLNQRKTIALKR